MNEIEQSIFDIIMKHMRINGSENCSTSEFESDVEDAAKEIAAQHSVQSDGAGVCPLCGDKLFCAMCGEHVCL